MIALAGTIGAGKTSLTGLLADHLNSQAFYESVDDNKILPLFYKDPKKYGFLLQIYFLNRIMLNFIMKHQLVVESQLLSQQKKI